MLKQGVKYKIAIVGAGNAGCITALHYYFHGRDIFDISIYHNPEEHPIEKVGQGTFPSVSKLISQTLNIDWHTNPIDATFKTGIMYEGWGKKQDKIFHPFGLHRMATHYVPQKLSKTVLESGFFEVIRENITDPEKQIDADIIFDCRGRNDRDKSNYDLLASPLNSVLLYKKEGRDQDLLYTRTVATPNGWTFVVPNIDSVSYGYLYNNTITSLDEATNDFLERFELPGIDDQFTFQNYIAKNVFVGDRTILNGNRCGFLEPLEATASVFYESVCRYVWDGLFNIKTVEQSNDKIRSVMKRIENYILWHYQTGSKYDTPFWDYAKSLPFNPDEKFNRILQDAQTKDYIDRTGECYTYWCRDSFKYWYDGVTL